jgi:glycosyltransferase involved in cell wall biosynthesis
MPQHTPMLVAAKSSGANVVARLDTHGYNSPWCGFWPYLRVSFYSFREHHNSAIAAIKAFSKTLLYAFPQLYDRKMLAHLSLADGIGIESQGAYKIFGGLLRSYKRHDLLEKLHVIHHPVIPEIENMEVSTRDERDNCIVAVGRWNSPQKDAPLLIKTLAKSLASNPTWRADIYGSGESELHKLVAKYAANVKELIHIHGPKPHEQILQAYQMSKICLFTSRYESGPIAGEEALCLGCSLVGPPDVPSMHDLCAPQFGTLPSSRRSADISRALQSEITQWSSQQRDPISTSRSALEIYSAQAVCKQILSYLS